MEAAGIALAVVGLFQTCVQGYQIFSDASKAPKDAENAARRIRIEKAVFATWGEHFEIHSRPVSNYGKLKVFLRQGQTLNGVHDTLSAILETFTDVKKLDDKYDIVFQPGEFQGDRSPRDIAELLNRRSPSPARRHRTPTHGEMLARVERYKSHVTILGRWQWALHRKRRIQDLISDLREYNDDLIRLCTWEAQAQMNRGLPTVALPGHNTFVDLHRMADAAEDTATDRRSPSYEGRRRVASMARFKARIKTSSRTHASRRSPYLLDREDYLPHLDEGTSTLAFCRKNQTIVLIEWRAYAGYLEEDQIYILAKLLCAPNTPADFRALPCLGIFKDYKRSRYGLVFQLPQHIRSLPSPEPQSGDFDVRKPISLADLIAKVDSAIDLGMRFRLAKQLLASIIGIHTSGWLHKNICPESIIFLAAEPTDGPKGELKGYRKNLSRPYLVGYTFSRPDDVDDLPPVSVMEHHLAGPFVSGRRTQNIFNHPAKARDPKRRFRHTYDIYSLGLVLLEIGLWESLSKFTPTDGWPDLEVFREFVLNQLVPDLWGQCGSIYGGVVEECLTMQDDSKLEDEGQRRLCFDIAERLDRCVA